jgi:type II secretory pathway component PulL
MKKWLVVLWAVASLIAMGELGRVHYQHYTLNNEHAAMKAAIEEALGQIVPYIQRLEIENYQMQEWIARHQGSKLIHEYPKQTPGI